MTLKEFFQSKTFSVLLYSIGIVLVVLVIFTIGLFVGYHQARVSYRWGENYYRNFVGGPRGGVSRELDGNDFMNGHGLFGSILSITAINTNANGMTGGETLIVKGGDNIEKSVLVYPDTIITKNRDTVPINDLQMNMNIVAIGAPNGQGQMHAKLIRILPPYFSFPPGSGGAPPVQVPRD
jgi:hypothetical protein